MWCKCYRMTPLGGRHAEEGGKVLVFHSTAFQACLLLCSGNETSKIWSHSFSSKVSAIIVSVIPSHCHLSSVIILHLAGVFCRTTSWGHVHPTHQTKAGYTRQPWCVQVLYSKYICSLKIHGATWNQFDFYFADTNPPPRSRDLKKIYST